ncbi:MAG: hypothetical protein ABIB55_00920, partial [Candidatus Nealsonbacteria bacterium]
MEDFLTVLKELAEKFQPELSQRVRKVLDLRELRLLEDVFETYYQKEESTSRWYDPYHVLFSTLFAVHLTKTNESVSPLIVPAIILHDIGYIAIPNESKEGWNSTQSRILHMQKGAAIAAKVLAQIGFYNSFEIGIIVEMVATHDNGYLGIKTQDFDYLALRDADRVWVMHLISFYKDWISKGSIPLLELLRSRRVSFYQEPALDADNEDRISLPPFTNLAREWRDRQFNDRRKEVEADIVRNPQVFREYLEKHI